MSDHNCHEQKNLRPRGLRICSKYLCRSWQSFCALHTEQCFDCKNPNMEMTPALHIWDRVGGVGVGGGVGGRSRRWRGGWGWGAGWRGVGGGGGCRGVLNRQLATICVRSITHCDSVVGNVSC